MTITVFNRKGIQFSQGKGDVLALLVPSSDQILRFRDTGMTANDVAQRAGGGRSIPLWREELGATLVYGFLPEPLKQTRQGVKVWLASDFTPNDAEAFFFVFEQRWLVHGVKETDDEGRKTWRATILQHDPERILQLIADQAADLMLGAGIQTITVAVDGDLVAYGKLKELLAPLQLTPVPFSLLKPSARAKPLYRHRDFTLLMLISVFFIGLLLAAALVWLVINRLELSRVRGVVAGVRTQISQIQINDNLGDVSNPDDILKQLQKPFSQQPSAVIDAAGRLGMQLGELKSVDFQLQTITPGNNGAGNTPATMAVLPPEQRLVNIQLSKVNQKLLVSEEETARQLLPQMPWVRVLTREADGGADEARLQAVIQIDSPPGITLPSSTAVVNPVLTSAPADTTPTAVADLPVSGSVVPVKAPLVPVSVTVPGEISLTAPGAPPPPHPGNPHLKGGDKK